MTCRVIILHIHNTASLKVSYIVDMKIDLKIDSHLANILSISTTAVNGNNMKIQQIINFYPLRLILSNKTGA